MIGATPVRAPKRNCVARPPASWRGPTTVKRRSLAIGPVEGNSSRARPAVAITASVSVSESCGRTAASKLHQTSGELGKTSHGTALEVTMRADTMPMPTWPVIQSASIDVANTSGTAGHCGTRVSSNEPEPRAQKSRSEIFSTTQTHVACRV